MVFCAISAQLRASTVHARRGDTAQAQSAPYCDVLCLPWHYGGAVVVVVVVDESVVDVEIVV